jgi:hypothetical protein
VHFKRTSVHRVKWLDRTGACAYIGGVVAADGPIGQTMGSGATAARPALDRLIQVRILAPQPESDDCGPNLCVY